MLSAYMNGTWTSRSKTDAESLSDALEFAQQDNFLKEKFSDKLLFWVETATSQLMEDVLYINL
jgi:hypothetical protein